MGPRTPVRLTDARRVAVRQLKDLQKDRAARIRHTMDALLRWLFDTASDQTPINPALFLANRGELPGRRDVTLRQVMYRLVAAGLLPNTPPMYRRLSARTARARREDRFPDLIDTLRQVHVPPSWPRNGGSGISWPTSSAAGNPPRLRRPWPTDPAAEVHIDMPAAGALLPRRGHFAAWSRLATSFTTTVVKSPFCFAV
ncbi:hypothetical protein [Streptomyces olivaceiscleroticus]